MDDSNIIRLLGKLGELSGRMQAAIETEQWKNAVLIGVALVRALMEFHNAIEEKVEYCAKKFKEADAQEAASDRRDVEWHKRRK